MFYKFYQNSYDLTIVYLNQSLKFVVILQYNSINYYLTKQHQDIKVPYSFYISYTDFHKHFYPRLSYQPSLHII